MTSTRKNDYFLNIFIALDNKVSLLQQITSKMTLPDNFHLINSAKRNVIYKARQKIWLSWVNFYDQSTKNTANHNNKQ